MFNNIKFLTDYKNCRNVYKFCCKRVAVSNIRHCIINIVFGISYVLKWAHTLIPSGFTSLAIITSHITSMTYITHIMSYITSSHYNLITCLAPLTERQSSVAQLKTYTSMKALYNKHNSFLQSSKYLHRFIKLMHLFLALLLSMYIR